MSSRQEHRDEAKANLGYSDEMYSTGPGVSVTDQIGSLVCAVQAVAHALLALSADD